MDGRRQPVTFENPLYATAPGVSGDPAVIHATQVRKRLRFRPLAVQLRTIQYEHIASEI